MARSAGRGVLGPVALVLDVLAVALLVADVATAYQRDIPGLLVLSVVGVPCALAGSVATGILLIRVVRRVPRAVLIVGVAVVTITVVPIGGAAVAIGFGATPNPAATAEAVVGRTVEAAGGHRLCGSGDPGLGPDNTQPYFFALYELPAGVDVRPRVTAQAQRLGWTVSADPSGDLERTTPRLQIDLGAGLGDGACGEYGTVERAAPGMRLLQLQVLLPYR